MIPLPTLPTLARLSPPEYEAFKTISALGQSATDVAKAVAGGGGGGAPFVRADGTTPLTGPWNAGNFSINARNSVPAFNVVTYGADPTGVTDSTTAIQNAINAAVAAGGGRVIFPAGTHKVLTSLNCTNIQVPVYYEGVGRGTIIAASLTNAVFDFTGSAFQEILDLTVSGNGATVPTCAFLFARNNTAGSAGTHRMRRVWTMGYFSVAAVYNYASEEFQGYDCYLTNNVTNTAVVIHTGTNISGLASAYRTIATGVQSNSVIHWTGCEFNSYVGGASTDALRIDTTLDFSIRNGMLYADSGRSLIYIDATSNQPARMVFSSIRGETGGLPPLYGFRLVGGAGHSYITIADVQTVSQAGGASISAAVGSTIYHLIIRNLQDVGSTTITVDSLDMSDIDLGPNAFNGLFGITRSFIRGFSTGIALTRPDLSRNTTILYTDLPVLMTAKIDGSVEANGKLVLEGTTNATRTTSAIVLQPTAGSVGVGVTPATNQLLHIKGDNPRLALEPIAPATEFGIIGIGDPTAAHPLAWFALEGSTPGTLAGHSLAGAALVGSMTSNAAQIVAGGAVGLTLLSGGQVGIGAGATAPGSPLTIQGAAAAVAASQLGLGGTTATTVGAAGGAAALPATPLGYLIANVAGTQVKIPYYNN